MMFGSVSENPTSASYWVEIAALASWRKFCKC